MMETTTTDFFDAIPHNRERQGAEAEVRLKATPREFRDTKGPGGGIGNVVRGKFKAAHPKV